MYGCESDSWSGPLQRYVAVTVERTDEYDRPKEKSYTTMPTVVNPN